MIVLFIRSAAEEALYPPLVITVTSSWLSSFPLLNIMNLNIGSNVESLSLLS
jgi:hypothetical protein